MTKAGLATKAQAEAAYDSLTVDAQGRLRILGTGRAGSNNSFTGLFVAIYRVNNVNKATDTTSIYYDWT
jgi:hypothetical protein